MSLTPLREFIVALSGLIDGGADEATLLAAGSAQLGLLISRDDWLPEMFAQPHPDHYQQYLLYADPRERFSVVSFVWGAGQKTPVHDHTVWGIVGVLRGREREVLWRRASDGRHRPGSARVLEAGGVTVVSPAVGDIHTVENALDGGVSISIHVYGGNIGRIRRHVFVPQSDEVRPFVSGYANDVIPNLWS